ncbi:sortase B protein-sorting domain-containing protein [Ornithobacterium rhinotracheale]
MPSNSKTSDSCSIIWYPYFVLIAAILNAHFY